MKTAAGACAPVFLYGHSVSRQCRDDAAPPRGGSRNAAILFRRIRQRRLPSCVRPRGSGGARFRARRYRAWFRCRESDNWALKGAALAHGRGRVVISAVEHPAVYESARQLERLGFGLTVLPVDGEGFVSADDLAAVMDGDVFLVSVMSANNETGSIQPVRELAEIAHGFGALFHTDAVQTAGALPVSVKEIGADMLSLSAHKFGGPKGFGALYVKNGVRLEPLHSGGEQERGRRGGTSDVAGAAGTAAALTAAFAGMEENSAEILAL